MPFASQRQAKQFFVERIVAQARREGLPLSSDEEWMLSFSESDPEFAVDISRGQRARRSHSRIGLRGKDRWACPSRVRSGSREQPLNARRLPRGVPYPQRRRSLPSYYAQAGSRAFVAAPVGILAVVASHLTRVCSGRGPVRWLGACAPGSA